MSRREIDLTIYAVVSAPFDEWEMNQKKGSGDRLGAVGHEILQTANAARHRPRSRNLAESGNRYGQKRSIGGVFGDEVHRNMRRYGHAVIGTSMGRE